MARSFYSRNKGKYSFRMRYQPNLGHQPNFNQKHDSYQSINDQHSSSCVSSSSQTCVCCMHFFDTGIKMEQWRVNNTMETTILCVFPHNTFFVCFLITLVNRRTTITTAIKWKLSICLLRLNKSPKPSFIF